ncbi:MAG: DUF1330 domain-containing protein [Gammaproteobacteria bacterium]|nr:DUF1330 domain-containing protein [Pseudomonadales bacterium]MCP5347734.1 DUF1330 domain-containing protein [Pseudomonadales bacterium]
MTAYLIADITVHDPDKYQEYVRLVPAFIEKHGGHYKVRGGEVDCREGSWTPQRLIVLEFPSRKDAVAFLEDPDYQPVAAIRHESATTNLIVLDGAPRDRGQEDESNG